MFHLWRNAVRPAKGAPKRRRVRPAVEALEDRTLPANLAPTIFTDGGAGTGSLRDMVITANSNGDDNVITLQGGTYSLTLRNGAAGQENAAATGDLDLTAAGHTIVIQGQGPTRTIIDGDAGTRMLDRLFHVFEGVTVVFRDLTLRGGFALEYGTAGDAPSKSEARGGCILNAGTLTLDDVVVTHNQAFAGNGENVGPGENGFEGFVAAGGGIYNTGTLNVLRSTIRDNVADGGNGSNGGDGGDVGGSGGLGAVALGGGLYNDGGTVTLTASTVAYNEAIGGKGGNGGDGRTVAGGLGGDGGGGIGGGLRSSVGTLTLIDSTVASNCALGGNAGQGGEVTDNLDPGGAGGNGGDGTGGGVSTANCQLSFRNSTVAFNTASGARRGPGGGGGAADGVDGKGSGGGVHAISLPLAVANAAASSLFGDNTADTGPDFAGTFATVDHTLVANGQGAGGIRNGDNGNIVGVGDPLLGQLADNGGPTLTVALLPGSPALNRGTDGGLATDQRGLPRVSGGRADIGAFEFQVPRPPVVAERAIVAALVNEVLVTRKAGRHRLFFQLFVRVSFADTGALKAEFLSPFQSPRYRSIAVSVFNADGDGVADSVRLTARRGRRRVVQVFGLDDTGIGGGVYGA